MQFLLQEKGTECSITRLCRPGYKWLVVKLLSWYYNDPDHDNPSSPNDSCLRRGSPSVVNKCKIGRIQISTCGCQSGGNVNEKYLLQNQCRMNI